MKGHVLVVDDNLLNRKLACDLLILEGYEVRQCEDAQQALELLAHGRLPDVILMDISLPGMDGLTLTRRLKADPAYAQIPVIAITAFAMKGDEKKALDAGCTAYVTKPIDTRKLPEQVAQAIAADKRERTRLRIMVVEDHRLDMKLVGENARLSGHVVLSNTTAEEALSSLGEGHPDVVLLDLNLPGMNGLSFLRLLKANPATRDLPVVATTAYPDDFQRNALLDAGCAAYVIKPVNMQQLLRELEAASQRVPPGSGSGH